MARAVLALLAGMLSMWACGPLFAWHAVATQLHTAFNYTQTQAHFISETNLIGLAIGCMLVAVIHTSAMWLSVVGCVLTTGAYLVCWGAAKMAVWHMHKPVMVAVYVFVAGIGTAFLYLTALSVNLHNFHSKHTGKVIGCLHSVLVISTAVFNLVFSHSNWCVDGVLYLCMVGCSTVAGLFSILALRKVNNVALVFEPRHQRGFSDITTLTTAAYEYAPEENDEGPPNETITPVDNPSSDLATTDVSHIHKLRGWLQSWANKKVLRCGTSLSCCLGVAISILFNVDTLITPTNTAQHPNNSSIPILFPSTTHIPVVCTLLLTVAVPTSCLCSCLCDYMAGGGTHESGSTTTTTTGAAPNILMAPMIALLVTCVFSAVTGVATDGMHIVLLVCTCAMYGAAFALYPLMFHTLLDRVRNNSTTMFCWALSLLCVFLIVLMLQVLVDIAIGYNIGAGLLGARIAFAVYSLLLICALIENCRLIE